MTLVRELSGVNVLFAHDTEAALAAAAALVNTLPGSVPGDSDPDTLTTVAELDRLVDACGWTGRRERTRAELEQVRALRARLARLWTLDEGDAVAEVNAMLSEHGALPQLVRHGEWSWHLHAVPADAPLATRIAVEAAMAMVDVIRAGRLDRLRRCAAEDCDDVIVDLSKNRSRRYCDGGCGNRANVAAYRARRAGPGRVSVASPPAVIEPPGT
jgi:predicted RNA-binding Zn ribbon-like protein